MPIDNVLLILEAGIDAELGGIIYQLATKYDLPISKTAKLVFSSEAYSKLSNPESFLYKEDLLKLIEYFETDILTLNPKPSNS